MMVEMQGLGRRIDPRPERANFPLRAVTRAAVVRRNRYWAMFGFPLDQGRTGTCVGHAMKHWDLSVPVIRTKRLGPPTGIDFYLAATTHDPWHNGQPDHTLQDGTSMNAAMLALRALGYIGAFHWSLASSRNDASTAVDDLIDYLCTEGPALLGTVYYNSMFSTTPEGFLRPIPPGDRVAGGHAYLANGVDVKRGFVYGPNSWGRPVDFGRLDPKTGLSDGRWRMDLDLLRRLLSEDGEAVAGTELPKPAPSP